jgi:hypothetical protein
MAHSIPIPFTRSSAHIITEHARNTPSMPVVLRYNETQSHPLLYIPTPDPLISPEFLYPKFIPRCLGFIDFITPLEKNLGLRGVTRVTVAISAIRNHRYLTEIQTIFLPFREYLIEQNF